MAKLEAHLQDKFFVVRYPLRDVLNSFDLQYLDILLSMALQLAEKAKSEKLELAEVTLTKLETLWSFGKDIDVQRETGLSRGGETNIGIGGALAALLQLSARLKSEHSTREAVREKVKHRVSDLLEGLDTLARDIESLTQKQVLCIVEDLDKIDLGKAKDIFYSHGESISAPEVAIIYTFPIALRRSAEFKEISNYYSATYTLRNFKVEHKNGEPDEAGRAALRQILLNRLEPNLLGEDALESLINYSGGLPRELIRFARDACVEADISGDASVNAAHVIAVISEERKKFEGMLSEKQLSLLKTAEERRHIDQTEAYRELLHTLSLLEYENDELWYDVNPVVKAVLPSQ